MGFYFENAAVVDSCFQKTNRLLFWNQQLRNCLCLDCIFSIAHYHYDDETEANCWYDQQAFVKQLIFGLVTAVCLASYFQIAS